ncbi:MAG: protease Lon-related BREX system protein BrxL [Bacteroidota bacterium]
MLDNKINEYFAGKVVRKDLTQLLKGNAVVPSYVLEYLLGQYCASDEEETIQSGLATVKDILGRHFVHRDEAELIKATVREKAILKLIDRVEVALNEKKDCYEASFSNLGIRRVMIDDETVKNHPKLLTGGVWCIVDLGYLYTEDKTSSPWIIDKLKPIQISLVDVDEFKELRKAFTTEEWMDLLLQSLGLNPEHFERRTKLLQLTRLIPFCENNYNLIELGPKGTGKSHVFSEFSPHGILISGGDVTQAKLFVNNSSGKIGLVGFWDTVAFDEFAGKDKKVDKKLVDIMKNYMANKSFSRGRDMYGATASMAFVGNTDHSVPYMLKHSTLFESLPKGYLDSAFLDRLHCYLPGWEVNKLRNEMFSKGYGFIVDYLAEIFKALRKEDYGHAFKEYYELAEGLTSRDRDGVTKTFSGLMKLIFPHGEYTKKEVRRLLEFAMEGRKRVKNQLLRIDATFEPVDFAFTDKETGQERIVETLEVEENQTSSNSVSSGISVATPKQEGHAPKESVDATQNALPKELKKVVLRENQSGVSYEKLFGPYLQHATEIRVVDPCIRHIHQIRNMYEFLLMLLRIKPKESEIIVHLTTKYDYDGEDELRAKLNELSLNLEDSGLTFEFDFEQGDHFHDRGIFANSGWKISLSRGLDIFQRFDYRNRYDLANHLQEYRKSKGCEIFFEPEE